MKPIETPEKVMTGAKMSMTPMPSDAEASVSATTSRIPVTEPSVPTTLTPPSSVKSNPLGGMQTQQLSPAAQKIARESMFGRAVHALFTGENTNYTVNPQTGQMVATTTKEKPGQLFRSILAGALLGGMAGSHAREGGFASGLAAGGAAEIANNQRQDLLKREQARQNFADQNKAQELKNSNLLTQARIKSLGLTNLRSEADLDLHSQEFVQESNQRNQQIAFEVAKAGGEPAKIESDGININGMPNNGAQLQKLLSVNPSLQDAPTGYSRVWTMQTDYSGLHFSDNGRWVSDKTGKPVDLSTRTKWTAYDVPFQNLHKTISVSGKTLNSLGYKMDPNQNYNLSLSGYLSLQQTALRNKQVESEIRLRQSFIDKRSKKASRVNALNERLRELYGTMPALIKAANSQPETTAEKKAQQQAQQQLKDTQSQIATYQNQIDGLLGAGNVNPNPNPNPAKFSVTAPNGKTYDFRTQAAADEFKKRAGIK